MLCLPSATKAGPEPRCANTKPRMAPLQVHTCDRSLNVTKHAHPKAIHSGQPACAPIGPCSGAPQWLRSAGIICNNTSRRRSNSEQQATPAACAGNGLRNEYAHEMTAHQQRASMGVSNCSLDKRAHLAVLAPCDARVRLDDGSHIPSDSATRLRAGLALLCKHRLEPAAACRKTRQRVSSLREHNQQAEADAASTDLCRRSGRRCRR